MSQKLKDIPKYKQEEYYDIFMAHDKSYSFMWFHYSIHRNTMNAIVRNVLRSFIKEKEKELEKLRREK